MHIDPSQFVPSAQARTQADQPVSQNRQARARGRAAAAQQPPAPVTPQHSMSIRVDQAQRVYYLVINDRTGEVVLQIPPEEVLRAARSVDEFLRAQQTDPGHALEIES